MTATLLDVARLAQVSEATASRVLRDKGPISRQARESVLAAVEKLGYVPNRAAGALASAGSPLVGVILPSMTNIVFPEVLRGINAGLAGTGYQALVGITDYDLSVEQSLVTSLLAWSPAAIITTGFHHTESTRRRLGQGKARVVELMDIDAEPIDIAVGLSHRKAGEAVARHLVEKGYRRFGYVGHDWNSDRRARLRYDGLRGELARNGLELVDQTLFDGLSSVGAGREMLAGLLQRRSDLDIVVFSNDDMALGGLFHCLSTGIRVKQELSLFGFNGLEIGDVAPLRLSTLRSNRFLIGKTAVEAIFEPRSSLHTKVVHDTGFEIIEGETA